MWRRSSSGIFHHGTLSEVVWVPTANSAGLSYALGFNRTTPPAERQFWRGKGDDDTVLVQIFNYGGGGAGEWVYSQSVFTHIRSMDDRPPPSRFSSLRSMYGMVPYAVVSLRLFFFFW